MAVPLSEITCGLDTAPSDSDNEAARLPDALGVNVTPREQVDPAAVALQVLELTAKSEAFAPLMLAD